MVVEADIVRQLKQRDITAFRWLYDSYAPALYGMILKLAPDKGMATTILEKSFLKFGQQIASFDTEKDKLFLWMVRVTVRHCREVMSFPNEIQLQEIGRKEHRHKSA